VTTVTIAPTGVLRIDGGDVFPIGFSNPPPLGGQAPSGKEGLQELKAGGASFIRTGRDDWDLQSIDAQIAAEKQLEDAAAAHGLHCWLWLGETPNLPTTAGSVKEQLLTRITAAFKGHAALGAYKGFDEPRNPFRGANWIRHIGIVGDVTRKMVQAAGGAPVWTTLQIAWTWSRLLRAGRPSCPAFRSCRRSASWPIRRS
jgi:hypothetical protein